ncbi:MAG: YndJ family transporter, partial [Myxococcota bacterium]
GGFAALLLVPWLASTLWVAVRERAHFWRLAAAGFSLTAALALIASRLEVTLFDIPEPIVKLTALHFTYAGAGTLTLARRLHLLRPSRWTSLAQGLVLVAPPVVAAGFVFRSALGQVGGATLMTLGVWLVAALQLPDARGGRRRVAWMLSSLSPLAAMVLAVAWAANQYWPAVPALTVPDMVPTHGALNAFGFVGCGLFAAER